MDLACLLLGYVEGMHVHNKNHDILCVSILWPITLLYMTLAPHMELLWLASHAFYVNGDTWATIPVKYYSETPCGYWVIPRFRSCVSKVHQHTLYMLIGTFGKYTLMIHAYCIKKYPRYTYSGTSLSIWGWLDEFLIPDNRLATGQIDLSQPYTRTQLSVACLWESIGNLIHILNQLY
jgi:hypothetical protein